jgi:hypothetical protein
MYVAGIQPSNCRANGDMPANRIAFDRRPRWLTERVNRLVIARTFVSSGEAGATGLHGAKSFA